MNVGLVSSPETTRGQVLWLACWRDGTIAGVIVLSQSTDAVVRLGVIHGVVEELGPDKGWRLAGRASMQVVTEVRYSSLDVALAEAEEFERTLLAEPGWQPVADVDG